LQMRRIEELRKVRQVQSHEESINPYGDWSLIVTSHGEYKLKPLARTCFNIMYHEYKKTGRTLIGKTHVITKARIFNERIDNIFRRSNAWAVDNSKLVGSGGNGLLRINL
jgi:hypothetical protein